jgi:hypothetical protein
MCEIKAYNNRILDSRRQLAFRVDFYSMSSFCETYSEFLVNTYKRDSFTIRELTDIERELVDVDAVADVMDSSVGDIIDKKNYIIRGLLLISNDEVRLKADAYISPYYLFVSVCENEQHIEDDGLLAEVYNALSLAKFSNAIDVQGLTLYTQHEVKAPSLDELFKIVDKTSFPLLKEEGTLNGRYSDTRIAGRSYVSLVRIIRQGEFEGSTCYQMSVSTQATPHEDVEIGDVGSLGGLLVDMFENAKNETTRCFN